MYNCQRCGVTSASGQPQFTLVTQSRQRSYAPVKQKRLVVTASGKRFVKEWLSREGTGYEIISESKVCSACYKVATTPVVTVTEVKTQQTVAELEASAQRFLALVVGQ